MSTLNSDLREYTAQLGKGQIQRAYKGIMSFMYELKAHLEGKHPEYAASALYFGYMDMTYFAFTPPDLRDRKLKIAIVYLHEENRFEVWLAANNRKLQADCIQTLSHKDLGIYSLSQMAPGVDAIIAEVIIDQPDYDCPNQMKERIETKTLQFAEDMFGFLS
jgi:hypothetical protein